MIPGLWSRASSIVTILLLSCMSHERVFTCSSALAAGARDAGSAAPGDYGTVKGRLVWGSAEAPAAKILYTKGDPVIKDGAVCGVADLIDQGLVVDPSSKGIRYGIAYLVAPKGSNPEAEQALLQDSASV